ncbi:MAG: cell wall metabolism sensor histidine kinase WalK [Chloroflexi bacterium]|nr:cell wall metabolism sensor histidine kinase WalK [Chloroflexota bacterium]
MESLTLIVLAGLGLALAAALLVIRRRDDELDALLAQLAPARAPAATDEAPFRPPPAPEPADDLLPVGTLHVTDGRIARANPRAHELLGIAPGHLVGRTVMEAFLDTRIEGLLAGIPSGGIAARELRMPEPDPRIVVLRARRREGEGLDVVLEDVSELHRLQQIRSAFVDNLSHELRTPLSTVSLLAETLAREADASDVPPRMRDRIAKIEVETGHLVQMVNEMLDLARIEGGSPPDRVDDVDVGRLAESSVERLRLFAERQGVTLVVAVEEGVPRVRGDESRLGQVIVNLVHNAVKFSPDGGEVRVTVGHTADAVLVAVIDHGVGIDPADRDRVFERFYKADRARVREGGTGLGLSIARHILEGHGGRIRVESEPGRGSTFSFTIPLVPADIGA